MKQKQIQLLIADSIGLQVVAILNNINSLTIIPQQIFGYV